MTDSTTEFASLDDDQCGDPNCRCMDDPMEVVHAVQEQGFEIVFPDLTPRGSAQCPKCSKFARIVVAGHYDITGDWTYTTDCKTCGRQSC